MREFTSRVRSLVQVQDSPAALGEIKKKSSDLFMHASLDSGIGDIAQLVERHPCNWVVALTGWMPNCLGGNDSIFYLNRWLTFSQEWGRGLEHATEKLY